MRTPQVIIFSIVLEGACRRCGERDEKREEGHRADRHVSTPESGQEQRVASSFHTLFPRKSEILDGLRSHSQMPGCGVNCAGLPTYPGDGPKHS